MKRRTQSRFLSPTAATVVRRQIQRGQQFRSEVDAYWKRCEQVADQELSNLEAAYALAALDGLAAFVLWLHGPRRHAWGWTLLLPPIAAVPG